MRHHDYLPVMDKEEQSRLQSTKAHPQLADRTLQNIRIGTRQKRTLLLQQAEPFIRLCPVPFFKTIEEFIDWRIAPLGPIEFHFVFSGHTGSIQLYSCIVKKPSGKRWLPLLLFTTTGGTERGQYFHTCPGHPCKSPASASCSGPREEWERSNPIAARFKHHYGALFEIIQEDRKVGLKQLQNRRRRSLCSSAE